MFYAELKTSIYKNDKKSNPNIPTFQFVSLDTLFKGTVQRDPAEIRLIP
jgi:hypothetical protein